MAKQLLKETQYRDEIKKQAAIDAGYAYIVIKYDELDRVTEEEINSRYIKALENLPAQIPVQQKKKTSFYYDKEKAREIRKMQYQQMKEWRKNNDRSNR